MKLSNEERETLLTYDYHDKTVSVSTTQESVKRRLEKRLGDRPGVRFGGSAGAWTIDIPMTLCRKPDQLIRPSRTPMSLEQRAQVSQRLAPYRPAKKTAA